jgi:hypothetical protein
MSARDELIVNTADLKDKCGVSSNMIIDKGDYWLWSINL